MNNNAYFLIVMDRGRVRRDKGLKLKALVNVDSFRFSEDRYVHTKAV
jgi:hypothetical protein